MPAPLRSHLCASRSVVSDPVCPYGLQPARLLCPWDSPGQNTGVGLPCPPPGDLPHPETEPGSSTLQKDYLSSEPPGKPPPHPLSTWYLLSPPSLVLLHVLGLFITLFLFYLGLLTRQSIPGVSLHPGIAQHFYVFFFFFFGPLNLRDLSSLTRDRTQALGVRAQSPTHWTAREFPIQPFSMETLRKLSSGPGVGTLCFHFPGAGFDPWLGNWDLCLPCHAAK